MKIPAAFAVAALAAVAFSQDPPKIQPKPLDKNIANELVTVAEAKAVFAKAEQILRKRLALGDKPLAGTLPEGNATVTRDQVIQQYARLYALAKPAFKLTPKPTKFEASDFSVTDPAVKENLTLLVVAGTIAPRGPVAAGSAKTITVRHLGDSMGYFLARIAQLTRLPSSKYTPGLME